MANAKSPTFPGPELFRLDGRVAIITGGAGELGAAMAHGLAQAGANVALADLNGDRATAVAAEVAGHGVQAFGVGLDVRNEAQVDAAVKQTVDRFGRLDILINSAGISARGAALDYELERFRNVLDVNMVGSFLFCRAAGRIMVPAGRGSIINIASIAGMVGYGGNLAYLSSKGGVVQLTRALAMEWARTGVRVNAISPCVIETAPVAQQIAKEPEFYVEFLRRHPYGRFGRVDEIVGPALFLASDAASLVTGHILPVDGGYTAQ